MRSLSFWCCRDDAAARDASRENNPPSSKRSLNSSPPRRAASYGTIHAHRAPRTAPRSIPVSDASSSARLTHRRLKSDFLDTLNLQYAIYPLSSAKLHDEGIRMEQNKCTIEGTHPRGDVLYRTNNCTVIRYRDVSGSKDYVVKTVNETTAVMRFGGQALCGVLELTGSMNTKLDLLINAANALWELHRNNIVHRDVKPANFLVSDKGRVCITDMMDTGRYEPGLDLNELRPKSCEKSTFLFSDPVYEGHNGTGYTVDVHAFGIMMLDCLLPDFMAQFKRNPLASTGLKIMCRDSNKLRKNIEQSMSDHSCVIPEHLKEPLTTLLVSMLAYKAEENASFKHCEVSTRPTMFDVFNRLADMKTQLSPIESMRRSEEVSGNNVAPSACA